MNQVAYDNYLKNLSRDAKEFWRKNSQKNYEIVVHEFAKEHHISTSDARLVFMMSTFRIPSSRIPQTV